jgi:hypothetical protein
MDLGVVKWKTKKRTTSLYFMIPDTIFTRYRVHVLSYCISTLALLASEISNTELRVANVIQPVSHDSQSPDVWLRRQGYMFFTRSSICAFAVYCSSARHHMRSVQHWRYCSASDSKAKTLRLRKPRQLLTMGAVSYSATSHETAIFIFLKVRTSFRT